MSEERVRARDGQGPPAAGDTGIPWPGEFVAACCVALVVAPILVLVTGEVLVFIVAGALLAVAVVVVPAAALEDGHDPEQGPAIAVVPTWVTVAVMAAGVFAALAWGGRAWSAPAILLPAGAGWLVLQSGVAQRAPAGGPGGRDAGGGTGPASPVNLTAAYATLVAVVLLPLLAWLTGIL